MTHIRHATRRGAVWRRHFVAIAFLLVFGLAQANGARPEIELFSEQFTWTPQLAPHGPVLIVVSLLEQQAYVYRNGIRIGMTPVSTGKPGYETPTGVFTILQKHREHYSNRYDNGPMPYMQRLTWDGIALHAGYLPGYPASHGCVRLPYAFSEALFGITTQGMTVVVTDSISGTPVTTAPGLFSSRDPSTGEDAAPPDAMSSAWTWRPDRSLAGPLNLLLSTRDQQMIVLRNGIEIGWAPIEFRDVELQGTYVYTLLEGNRPAPSPVVIDRPALNWLAVPISGNPLPASDAVREAVVAGRLLVPQAFARHVYDALTLGATLVVTDEPLRSQALLLPGPVLEAIESTDARPTEPDN